MAKFYMYNNYILIYKTWYFKIKPCLKHNYYYLLNNICPFYINSYIITLQYSINLVVFNNDYLRFFLLNKYNICIHNIFNLYIYLIIIIVIIKRISFNYIIANKF